ncbi:hypothetical protein [Novosphingobium sp. TH158]|uniref:hypothetical protein n=1 Tax=Novosphingobium sp. TH158 TaxID=2067455 RepID=UPI000C7E3810|nr:hypothetical protein [Novosphingobium sp. TH158]PLK27103.1 hypothetical protein C0V78_09560 [Novosphingobium sp. TH158]
MIEKADQLLKLALAVAALLIGVSVSYYYAIFLPQVAQTKLDRERSAELARATSESTAAMAKEKRLSDAKAKYNACLADAFENYQSRWQKTCRRLNGEDLEKKRRCMDGGGYYCDSIKITPATNCSLPNDLGDDYDTGHENDKKMCLEEFKASS